MGKERKSMPSKAQIAEHWKDKTMPYSDYLVITDWFEPSCWACGSFGKNEDEGVMIERGDFDGLWNHPSYGLERCHVVPKALGGSNDVDNLFLMCSICHESSPDTTNRESFFNWVIKRTLKNTYEESVAYQIVCRLQEMNIDYTHFMNFYNSDETRFLKAQEQMDSHGFKFVKSTLIEGYLSYFLENWKEVA